MKTARNSVLRNISRLALCLLFAAGASCGASHGHDNDEHDEQEEHEGHEHDDSEIVFTHEQAEAAGLQTEHVRLMPFANVIKCTGRIQMSADGERVVSAPASGVVSIAGARLTDGMAVNAGQLLYSISSRGLELSDPTAALKVRYESAKREYERAKPLVADKIITQTEFATLEAEYRTAAAELSNIANRAAGGKISVSAPIAGYVIEQIVRPGDFVEQGAPLLVISQSRRVQLRADVPQQYTSRLGEIVSANFIIPQDAAKTYSLAQLNGRKVSTSTATDASGGYVPVIFEFDNSAGLATGTYVEAYLLCRNNTEAISVPVSAITEEQGLYFVYIKISDHAYRKQEVRLGTSNGDRIEITEGLKTGDEVVTRGAVHLKLAANTGQIPEGHSHNH